jgi:putative ABC transport system permease protein
MSFLSFFWRDFKSDKAFNGFYLLCAALGILGLLLVESFKGGVEEKVSSNAKNFIASDLSISTRRMFTDEEKKTIETYLQNNHFHYSFWIETYSLVSKTSADAHSKLANLNFVSEDFPYYGGLVLEQGGLKGPGNWHSLHEKPRAWINRDFSWEMNLKPGDQVKVGELNVEVADIILEDKFSSFRGFSLAPKIFISTKFLAATDLIKFGSTSTHAYVVKLPAEVELKKVQEGLKKLINDRSIKIVGPTEASQQISRSLLLLADYLSLITLLTYLLSLIGLYYFSQHFLSSKLKVFSIYKAMGVKTSFLFKVNFFHLLALTALAVFVSTLSVIGLLPFIEQFFEKLTGEDLSFHLSLISIGRILIVSFVGSMLALGPLYWGALQTPVATVFQDLPAELKRLGFIYFIPLFLYVIALSMFLANSFKIGGLFVGALTAIILLAAVAFKFFTYFLDKSSEKLSFVNKHAVKTLSRYFTSSFTVFICLLLGMTLVTFISQLETSLRSEFTQTYGNRRPDLFMFDLQDSQFNEFEKLVSNEKWNQTLLAPMIRARLLKVNDTPTIQRNEPGESQFATREDENSERMKNRGVNLSYRNHLSWSERIVEGRFPTKPCVAETECEISLEQSYARRIGVKMGDHLVFDVSGIEVQGKVTSLRKVKWTSFEPNFFILFQPGVLEEAPKTFLASFKAPTDPEKRKVFSLIASQFPNVSVLDVSELIKKITSIFDLMAMAIKFISILSLALAMVVLVAVSFNHLDLRRREMNLFRLMGLRKKVVGSIYIREFGLLVGLCLILSPIFGSVMTKVLMAQIFDGEAFYRITFILPFLIGLGIFLSFVVAFRVKALLNRKEFFS